LTEEQRVLFKKLYLEGHTAQRIFEELGQPTVGSPTKRETVAESRMIYYRNKLGLPKRGYGFRTIDATRHFAEVKQERLKKRYGRIPVLIARTRARISKLEKELQEIKIQLGE